MQTLPIDPPQPYLVPAVPTVAVLVGCGGTGSVIAQHLARLAWHLQAQGAPPLHLCFIDGDRVESRNIGRQQFCPAEIGQNKAQTLATRLSTGLGLTIEAIPHMATVDLLREYRTRYGSEVRGLLIGAVDTPEARGVLHAALAQPCWHLWLDGGNHEHAGQVVVGSVTEPAGMTGAFRAGVCGALPSPALVYPDLITPRPDQPRGNCAAALAVQAQGLMVNSAVALVAGQYLVDLLLHRRLVTFATDLHLQPCTMRSRPITPQQVALATGLEVARLQGKDTAYG